MKKTLCIGYMTGAGGTSVGLYYFGDGVIAGVDMGGMKIDGSYRVNDDGTYTGSLSYAIPINAVSVTGLAAPQGQQITVPLQLPAQFLDGRVIRVETPLGPINVRFEVAKELP